MVAPSAPSGHLPQIEERNLGEKVLIPTGEIPESVCPRCKKALMVVTKRKALRNYDGSLQHPQFVGCTQYPQCGYMTHKITPEIEATMWKVQAARDAMPALF